MSTWPARPARCWIACAKKSTNLWRLNTAMKHIGRQAIFYTALIGLWFVLAKLHVWPPYVFPTPWGVWDSLVSGFQDHSFWIAIGVSMKRMILGYAISVLLGMILGLGIASNKFLE